MFSALIGAGIGAGVTILVMYAKNQQGQGETSNQADENKDNIDTLQDRIDDLTERVAVLEGRLKELKEV